MYSRTPMPPPRRVPMGRPSYVRPRRPDFRVPPNYGGSAFQPRSAEEDLYATLPEQDRPPEPTDTPRPAPPADDAPPPVLETPEAPSALPPSALFRGLQGFPFGHGIGYEELLLMGLIYFLLKEGEGLSDRGDLDQTVLLLAALLFCG